MCRTASKKPVWPQKNDFYWVFLAHLAKQWSSLNQSDMLTQVGDDSPGKWRKEEKKRWDKATYYRPGSGLMNQSNTQRQKQEKLTPVTCVNHKTSLNIYNEISYSYWKQRWSPQRNGSVHKPERSFMTCLQLEGTVLLLTILTWQGSD